MLQLLVVSTFFHTTTATGHNRPSTITISEETSFAQKPMAFRISENVDVPYSVWQKLSPLVILRPVSLHQQFAGFIKHKIGSRECNLGCLKAQSGIFSCTEALVKKTGSLHIPPSCPYEITLAGD